MRNVASITMPSLSPASDCLLILMHLAHLSALAMKIEVMDISLDKQHDCEIAIVNGTSQYLELPAVPNHDVPLDSYEGVSVASEQQSEEGSTESKEYEVKECTTETMIVSTGISIAEQSKEDQSAANSNFEAGLEEKVKPETKASRDENKLHNSPKKHATKSGVARTKYTVPRPFSLATEKRASSGPRPSAIGTKAGVNKKSKGNNMLQPNTLKQNQPLSVARRPLQPNNKKHPGEEDSCSVTSSTGTSVQKMKTKSVNASPPTFRCTQRAEKRKEFYSKLEEKHQALESEKTQNEARTKEEMEAAIKQLRKSLTFKANPMPSFYHEGPPAKNELKKVPPTRAKSPKLGRKKSAGGDAKIPSQTKAASKQENHLGNLEEDNIDEDSRLEESSRAILLEENQHNMEIIV
ncbi:Protein WVD2-like 3 [Linum perenne]